METSYLRLHALPISQTVCDFIASYDTVFVVENNFDGQLHKILLTETPEYATRLLSVAKCDGLPLSARFITEAIMSKTGEECRIDTVTQQRPVCGGPRTKTNAIGLEKSDTTGGSSTLCKGCGHDSISARIINSVWELGLDQSQVIKLSGIGCQRQKTPAYFLGFSHGFNHLHVAVCPRWRPAR